MNAAVLTPQAAASTAPAIATSAPGTPWYCRWVAVGATFILAGIIWDISWHSAIGRDTFWTPAHICIHFGGTLGGFICGWLVLRATFFGAERDRNAAVRLWGFRGPLGAWVTIWGALAMLTSAPFDNWWHDAYGLDVKILSPPHSILAAGMYFHVLGGLLLLLGVQNRAARANAEFAGTATHSSIVAPPAGRWLFVYAAAILVCLAAIMMTEESLPNKQHAARFYLAASAVYPFLLVPMARAAHVRFPATVIAGIYTALTCAAVWILPLFAATPMLAPIYNPVKNMVPPAFPVLLIAPAFAIDLLLLAFRNRRGWKSDLCFAGLAGVAFVSVFTAVQWQFAKFLISPAANNRLFAGGQFFTFADRRGPWWNEFWDLERDPMTAASFATAVGFAVVACVAGTFLGNWMKRVQR